MEANVASAIFAGIAEAFEVAAKRLQAKTPTDTRIKATLESVIRSRSTADEQVKVHAQTRKAMAAIWSSETPTADQLATIQRLKASVQDELLQMQALEPSREATFKEFMDSAGQVP